MGKPEQKKEVQKPAEEKKIEHAAKSATEVKKPVDQPKESDASKDQEKAKLDVLMKQVDKIIEEGAVQQKKSMYDEAVAIYTKAADLLALKKPEYSHLKKHLIEKEASIFGQIGACYKQTQSTKKEIEYCSKVIERAPYISDTTILAKAY